MAHLKIKLDPSDWEPGEWPKAIDAVATDGGDFTTVRYVPVRTCRMIDNGCELCCSECDCRHVYDDNPNYCHNCGAKVVFDAD